MINLFSANKSIGRLDLCFYWEAYHIAFPSHLRMSSRTIASCQFLCANGLSLIIVPEMWKVICWSSTLTGAIKLAAGAGQTIGIGASVPPLV
jgi:hypothetical protein